MYVDKITELDKNKCQWQKNYLHGHVILNLINQTSIPQFEQKQLRPATSSHSTTLAIYVMFYTYHISTNDKIYIYAEVNYDNS